MEIEFGELKEDELEEVANLYDAERPTSTNRKKMYSTFQKVKNNPDYIMIVGKYKDEIIAFAKVIIHNDIFEENNPFLTVWSIRVKKEYRKQKIGTTLFQYIEKIAMNKKAEFICLIADKENDVANHFYEKLGYQCENGYVKFLKEEK